jgi:hypothetical protein
MSNTPTGYRFRLGNIRGAKLTPEQVVEIRERYWRGMESQGALCRAYGVSKETIGRVVRGETFQEYGGPVPGGREKPPAQELAEAAEDHAALSAPEPDGAAIAASLAKLNTLLPPDKQVGGEPAGEPPALPGDNDHDH